MTLLFTSNQTARTHRETVGGVEYLVAPVVAIRAGVLNGELVPAEEISHHFTAWNGRPFVVGHPKNVDGELVPANDPEMLAQLACGQLFDVRFEGDALKGELWVDLGKAKSVDGGPEVVQRLESGKPLEVSTAYLRDRDEKPGTLDGVKYEAIARNLRPDHLAALLDAEGACSWADGCGAPRVNNAQHRRDQCMSCKKPPEVDVLWAEGMGRAWFCLAHYKEWKKEHPGEVVAEHKVKDDVVPKKWGERKVKANVLGKARRPTYSGTTDAPWEAPTLEGWLNAYPGDKPDSNRVVDLPQAAKNWIAGHTLLGDPNADNERELAFFPVVTPQGKLSGGAVRAVLGGRGAAAKIPQAAKESAQAMARALLDKEFKAEQATNRVLCALRTIAGAFGIEINQDTEVSQMEELIKAILEDGRLGFNKEQLKDLGQDVLSGMVKALKALPKAEQEEPEPEPESNEEPEAQTETQETEPKPETNEEMQVLEARLTALETAARADTDARQAVLVTALRSNAACALSEAQLTALDVGTLEGLHRSLSPTDYSGRGGGPVAGNDGITPLVMPDIFSEAQEA